MSKLVNDICYNKDESSIGAVKNKIICKINKGEKGLIDRQLD